MPSENPANSPLSAIVIGGTHSGAGKTTVTLGLIGALARRGLAVQPFKVGPDFIDPLHHTQAGGCASLNLDGWMLSPGTNRERFARATADADVAVIEGVMGLFDGSEGKSDRGSTAEMAKLLRLPVALVIDASAMARSAAALIRGFAGFDPDLRIAGVILNNVGGDAHAEMIREAIAGDVPVLGAIPRDPDLVIPERHLGLHLPHEAHRDWLGKLASLIEEHVDLDRLLEATRTERPVAPPAIPAPKPTTRVGIARDEAFCFYYADNLELLEQAGAELVEFSPIDDPLPEDLDGLYVGGGYPELHAAELAANEPALEAIRDFAAAGGPIYAECGGLMYLGETLELEEGAHPLCGVLPFSTRMPAPLKLAYVEIETTDGMFGEGLTARGHLFHHSEITGEPAVERCYRLRTSRGERSEEGYRAGNVLGSYVHLHFASAPQLAEIFLDRCRSARDSAYR
jgi:cobyrinic acid a,c-diamide synthase